MSSFSQLRANLHNTLSLTCRVDGRQGSARKGTFDGAVSWRAGRFDICVFAPLLTRKISTGYISAIRCATLSKSRRSVSFRRPSKDAIRCRKRACSGEASAAISSAVFRPSRSVVGGGLSAS